MLAPLLALAGCATPVAPPAGPDGAPPASWSGRFAVTWLEPGASPREERATGRFFLREAGSRTELDVYSPFGQTIARAVAAPEGASLETSDGTRHEAPSPEALTERVLGWRVPVARLPDWLRAAGRASGAFLESGWSVHVDAPDAGQRPSRLTLRWPWPTSADDLRRVTIRLVMDSAQAPATPEAR